MKIHTNIIKKLFGIEFIKLIYYKNGKIKHRVYYKKNKQVKNHKNIN